MVSRTVLNNLLKEYDKKQIIATSEAVARKQELYNRIPRLQEIEDELNEFAIKTARSILLNNTSDVLNNLHKQLESLKKERLDILKQDKKDLNYLLPRYECSKCKDTGYITENARSQMCSCLNQKLLDIEYNKANIGNLDRENFKNFNINLYSDEIDEKKYNSDISPRDNIKMIVKEIKKFIKNFDDPSEKNLLFSGGTGLGKTFLSNSIVAELLLSR